MKVPSDEREALRGGGRRKRARDRRQHRDRRSQERGQLSSQFRSSYSVIGGKLLLFALSSRPAQTKKIELTLAQTARTGGAASAPSSTCRAAAGAVWTVRPPCLSPEGLHFRVKPLEKTPVRRQRGLARLFVGAAGPLAHELQKGIPGNQGQRFKGSRRTSWTGQDSKKRGDVIVRDNSGRMSTYGTVQLVAEPLSSCVFCGVIKDPLLVGAGKRAEVVEAVQLDFLLLRQFRHGHLFQGNAGR